MIYIVHLAMWCMGFYQNGIYTQNGDVRGKVMIIMNLFFGRPIFRKIQLHCLAIQWGFMGGMKYMYHGDDVNTSYYTLTCIAVD